jgi:broad specificity phosphatase PhoE
MNLFLVRHGESEGNINKAKYFEMLDSDIGLTEQGKADAIKASVKIMNLSDMLVDNKTTYPTEKGPIYYNMFHSSYKRAKETANVIHGGITNYQGYQINKLIETPLCREREWGGLRDIVQMGKKTEDHFNFYYTPTGGESFADCLHRVATFHQWLLQTSEYGNNVVVAHGEFNKLYLMYLLNWSVEEFNKWKTPRNGEVYLVRNGELSSKTPLTKNNRK